MEKKESLLARLKRLRGAAWLVIFAALGIVMIVLGGEISHSAGQEEETNDADAYYSVRFYTEDLEERIAALCRRIDGVSEAHVLLTLEGGTEHVYAENESGSARDYVIIEDPNGDAPVLVQEIYPKIRGVAVVCTRGGDSEIQRTVTELLSAALGISTSRIRVAGT